MGGSSLVQEVSEEGGGVLDDVIEAFLVVTGNVVVKEDSQVGEILWLFLDEARDVLPVVVVEVEGSFWIADVCRT